VKFSGNVGNGPVNKCLNFGGDANHRLDTGIVFRIRQYWDILKVVNGHKSAAHTDSPDGGTSKTCIGGGMHCARASSLFEKKLPTAFCSRLINDKIFTILVANLMSYVDNYIKIFYEYLRGKLIRR